MKLMSWLAGFFVVLLALTGNGYVPALASESPEWVEENDGWVESDWDYDGVDTDFFEEEFFIEEDDALIDEASEIGDGTRQDVDEAAEVDGEKQPVAAAPVATTKFPESDVSGKIVGGVEVSPIFEAALIRTDASNNFQGQFCGGTIIDVRWILTAAHCVDSGTPSRPSGLVIQVGNATLSEVGPVQGLAVEKIIVHPGWNPTTWENDIALVQLVRPITLGPEAQIANLPAGVTPAGTQARVSGWGALRSGVNLFPLTLQAAVVEVVADRDCRGSFTFFDDNVMLCAGVPPFFFQADSCQGDSGGPLAINTGSGWEVIGVTSFGRGCASGTPGVYAEVRAFTGWISEAAGAAGIFSKAPRPKISGVAAQGERLVAKAGKWTPKPDAISYQWLRNGKPISGATKRAYRLKSADRGKRISVQVTMSRGNFLEQSRTSARTERVGIRFPSRSAQIAGTAQFGSTLRAEPGRWGTPNVRFRYQWLRDGEPISKATKSTYKLRTSDIGKRITVRVTGSKAGFATEARSSSATRKVQSARFTTDAQPQPTGTVQIGNRLRVKPGNWGTTKVRYSYQWLRNGKPIDGATKASYKLKRDDAGKRISVRITGKKSGYKTERVTSTVRRDWKTVTRTTTIAADQIFPVDTCRNVGTSENSCRAGGKRAGSGGVRLASAGGDQLMAVAGSVKLEGAPQRYRMTFNRVTKKRGSVFTVSTTSSKPQRQSRWREIGTVGTKSLKKSNYRTGWSTRVDGSRVRFVVSSTDPDSLYFRSITIEYDTIR